MSEVNHKRYSVEEVSESLSYTDEVLMETHFGTNDWTELSGTKTLRALLFVVFYRTGMKHVEAFEAVTTMSLGQVNEYFTEDDDTTDPDEQLDPDDEPVTEVGKDVEPRA